MLEIKLYLMAITGIGFIVLLFILNNLIYKPLLNFMNKRDEAIKKDKAAIEKLKREIEAINKSREESLKRAKEQAERLKKESIEKLEAIEKEEVLKAKKEAQTILEEFKKEVNSEKKMVYEGLLSQMDIFKKAFKNKFKKVG